jgi:hypothetical protein
MRSNIMVMFFFFFPSDLRSCDENLTLQTTSVSKEAIELYSQALVRTAFFFPFFFSSSIALVQSNLSVFLTGFS